MGADDFRVPGGASDKAKEAIRTIMSVAQPETGGGCRAFYTPEEWAERGERYGTKSVLVVCHDGGDLTHSFNPDYRNHLAMEKLQAELGKLGLYAELCTSWFSAIYPT